MLQYLNREVQVKLHMVLTAKYQMLMYICFNEIDLSNLQS